MPIKKPKTQFISRSMKEHVNWKNIIEGFFFLYACHMSIEKHVKASFLVCPKENKYLASQTGQRILHWDCQTNPNKKISTAPHGVLGWVQIHYSKLSKMYT